MSRFIPQPDMSGEQLVQCSYEARAIIHLCESAAWGIVNGSGPPAALADSIGSALRLALEMLEPVHDAIEIHEGMKGGAQ